MSKLTQHQQQLFKAQFVKFCRDRDAELDDDLGPMFEYFHRLRAKEQERLFQDFGKQHKVNQRAVRQYFQGEFAKDLLYQLTPEDKATIRQICAEMRGEEFNAVFGRVMSVLHGEQGKRVHIETVRQSVHYYVKKEGGKRAGLT